MAEVSRVEIDKVALAMRNLATARDAIRIATRLLNEVNGSSNSLLIICIVELLDTAQHKLLLAKVGAHNFIKDHAQPEIPLAEG